MKKVLILFSALLFLSFDTNAEINKNLPKKLECAFLLERSKNGKSNKAACAYTAEKVFTRPGKSHLYPRTELCSVDDVTAGHDYENFIVDFKKNKITYDEIYKISDFYKPIMKRYYIKKGKSDAEADKEVNFLPKPKKYIHRINKVLVSTRLYYRDPITKKFLSPPKKVRTFNVLYKDSLDELHTLSYAENIPEAIITSFTGNAKNSWTNLIFGKCRIVN